jgi:hypothetical protein
MNKHKQPGPTVLCERIARAISSETGVWFGSMDVANALARALAGERLACGQSVSMMLALSSGSNGLRATPNRLAAVAAALNRLAETDSDTPTARAQGQVTEAIVHTALVEVMRQTFGVIVVTVAPPKGELSFETAYSLAELLKRRAVAKMRERGRVGAGQPQRVKEEVPPMDWQEFERMQGPVKRSNGRERRAA